MSWVGPNEEKNCVPKDDGLTRMVSAFQSSEIGFMVALTAEQVQAFNQKRKGTTYQDGLNVNNMNKSFSGNKRKMHDREINQGKGYLGPYQRK